MPTTHSFILAVTMPKEREQGSSVSTVTVNNDSGTAISPSITGLIRASFAESTCIGALTDNLTQVIEDHLAGFATPSGFPRRIVPLSSKPLKRRIEKITPVRERETNSSWTMLFKWAGQI